jgi:hypothetical protein
MQLYAGQPRVVIEFGGIWDFPPPAEIFGRGIRYDTQVADNAHPHVPFQIRRI